jgi:hypothetical protein
MELVDARSKSGPFAALLAKLRQVWQPPAKCNPLRSVTEWDLFRLEGIPIWTRYPGGEEFALTGKPLHQPVDLATARTKAVEISRAEYRALITRQIQDAAFDNGQPKPVVPPPDSSNPANLVPSTKASSNASRPLTVQEFASLLRASAVICESQRQACELIARAEGSSNANQTAPKARGAPYLDSPTTIGWMPHTLSEVRLDGYWPRRGDRRHFQ